MEKKRKEWEGCPTRSHGQAQLITAKSRAAFPRFLETPHGVGQVS